MDAGTLDHHDRRRLVAGLQQVAAGVRTSGGDATPIPRHPWVKELEAAGYVEGVRRHGEGFWRWRITDEGQRLMEAAGAWEVK